MGKVFICADIHFSHSRWKVVDEAQWRFADWVLENVRRYGCERVFFLGDRFKDRRPDPLLKDYADFQFLRIARNVPLVCICGNHDFYYRSLERKENSFELLKAFGVEVVSSSRLFEIGDTVIECVAWGERPLGKGNILLGHLEVKDLLFWSNFDLTLDELKGYEICIFGHLHRELSKGNVLYIGVPICRGFGETSETGGVVLDTETFDIEVVAGFGPRFIEYSSVLSIEDMIGNVVRINDEKIAEELRVKGIEYELVQDSEIFPVEVINDFEIERLDCSIDYLNLVEEYGRRVGFNDEVIGFGREYVDKFLKEGRGD